MSGKILAWGMCLAWAAMAQNVFVVRHAERTGEPDPPLNEAGRQRAEALARTLAGAKVSVIVVTNTQRAQETAAPLARQMGAALEVFAQEDTAGMLRRVKEARERGRNALVVAHRASVPRIVAALGGGEIAALGAAEHDRLVILSGGGLISLCYGADTGCASAVRAGAVSGR